MPCRRCPVIRPEELIKDAGLEEGDQEWMLKKTTIAVAKSYNNLTI